MAQTTPNHTQTVSGGQLTIPQARSPLTSSKEANGVNDLTIEIFYCGICHTDLHYARNDWGITMYPVVPGHEITGVITKIGSNVRGFKTQFTYNGIFWDGSITYGGYSKFLVADHRYVVHVPDNLPLDAAAPLLCAGITVYSPMKDNKMLESPGKKLGIIGLGGLDT
ncbi:putative cinnamyl alcohol dehydrogenase 6 [Vitis vinifera]|uniref:Putative cinnamyl alcohol dehydrogenase 6 n=1 Tax=Vitis vinifera TaxID=29760 RepID=A0A438ETS8_VITVI|nr:putative cinnamyl alcohol dehydrogenase 6 [Vitis vinifera]